MNALQRLCHLGDAAIDFLLQSPDCIVCGSEDTLDRGVCAKCLSYLEAQRLIQPYCPICSLPGGRRPCPNCHERDFAFSRALSAYLYTGCARTLILHIKFHGEARNAAYHLAPAMRDVLLQNNLTADALLPMPLARARLASRGYNQSAYLAKALSKSLGIPLREDLLWRKRDTLPQAELGMHERAQNVRNAFAAHPTAKGLSVVLIDDVLTTGHTASSCAGALMDAGAKDVIVLTAARAAD